MGLFYILFAMWKFIKLIGSGFKEDPSCGCFTAMIVMFCIALCIPSTKTGKSSMYRKTKIYSKYNSSIYKPYEVLPDTVDSVYVCMSSSSYAFHARISCGALSNCRSVTRKIPVNKARNMGRTACQRCSRHITFRKEKGTE